MKALCFSLIILCLFGVCAAVSPVCCSEPPAYGCSAAASSILSDNATQAISCALNLVLSAEYAVQALILVIQSQNSEDPGGDLFAAGVTFLLAVSWYSDFLDCTRPDDDNETSRSCGLWCSDNLLQKHTRRGHF